MRRLMASRVVISRSVRFQCMNQSVHERRMTGSTKSGAAEKRYDS